MCSPQELQEILQQEVNTGNGLTFAVCGDQGQLSGVAVPTRLMGGVVSDVHDGKAYVAFKHSGKVFKTNEIKDRVALMAWADQPPEHRRKPFSNQKEHAGLVGPSTVTLHNPFAVATA